MHSMREGWTDVRLDDLNGKVDDLGRRMDNGFNRVDADIRALREETNLRFDGLQKTMILFCGGIITALLGLIATQL
jgi:hypothetical protein